MFHLTVLSGQFDVVKRSVAAISPDRRMQALLIAFSFGTFIEGAAGFGTPVAISAALLIGLGFSPLYAAGLALLANTSPVAFGALGTPITTLAQISGIDEMALSQMAGRQLPLFSLIVPAWLVAVMSGWRACAAAGRRSLVCGGSFAALAVPDGQLARPDAGRRRGRAGFARVAGGLSTILAARRTSGDFPTSAAAEPARTRAAHATADWSMLGCRGCCLSVMVFLWGWPSFKRLLNGGRQTAPTRWPASARLRCEVPELHKPVYRTARWKLPRVPIAGGQAREGDLQAQLAIGHGDGHFSGGLAVGVLAADSVPARSCVNSSTRCGECGWRLVTIACMLALAFITKYSGSDATLGLAFTRTGWLYPFFAPLLGWLGVALTGSDTSSQRPVWQLAAHHGRAIAASPGTDRRLQQHWRRDGQDDRRPEHRRRRRRHRAGRAAKAKSCASSFSHSVALACLVGLVTLAQAYLLSWMIPTVP